MDANTAALSVITDIKRMCLNHPSARVFKMFSGSSCAFYSYTNKDAPYLGKISGALANDADKEAAYNAIVNASGSDLKCARLTKNSSGWRFRFPDDCTDRFDALERVRQRILQQQACINTNYVRTEIPKLAEPRDYWDEYKLYGKLTPVKKERKAMNDFSLTNLKNALIDKVTHLDKKTVTILSIIALVLLVFCKYKDIKDIFNGIKTKIVNSDNFKEMVSDGTSAVNSLKKIVGVKGANSEA